MRLADRETPAMDQLYFYVRKMDKIVDTIKDVLNIAEDKYAKQPGPNIDSKIMNYFLRSKEKEDLQRLISYNEEDLHSDDDDSDDEGDLEDDMQSDDDEPMEPTEDQRCGTILERSWNKRSKALRSDIAIAGWMCSPHPDIMSECNAEHNGEHRLAVTRLLTKWFGHEVSYNIYFGKFIFFSNKFFYIFQVEHNEEKLGNLINDFWTEFEEFQSKTGVYKNREYIFKNHADLLNSRVFIWHKKETLRFTNIFGRFACRVCSKILGIGSAERSWGDVKHLKVNKRSHLSGERVKKQATIFGTSCIELAKFQRMQDLKDVSTMPLKVWTDDDFKICDDEVQDEEVVTKPRRIFKAFLEDWEQDAITKRDIVNEAKLLRKYGGLTWLDPDNDNVKLRANKNSLHWTRVSKKNGGGYCVNAIGPNYDENDPENFRHVEPWLINDVLIGEISHYYRNNPDEGVVVEDSPDQNRSNNNNDDDDDDDDNDDDDDGSECE